MKITQCGHMLDRGETVPVQDVSFDFGGPLTWANDVF